jgi:hypothetical protein
MAISNCDPTTLLFEALRAYLMATHPRFPIDRLRLYGSDGSEIKLRVVLGLAPPSPAVVVVASVESPATPPAVAEASCARHSPDFKQVHWFGTDYTFTGSQAEVVKMLWEAWEDGVRGIGQAALLEGADSTADRLRDLFRKHPAWQTMIRTVERATFSLSEPQSPQGFPGGAPSLPENTPT